MTDKEKLVKLKENLIFQDLHFVFDELAKVLESQNLQYQNDIVLLRARFRELQQVIGNKTLSYGKIDIHKNRILVSVIDFIDRIDKETINLKKQEPDLNKIPDKVEDKSVLSLSRMAISNMGAKVVLTGSSAVGKTSLFNQFIYQHFDDRYLTSIGVKVNRKIIIIEGERFPLLVWDIAGEASQNKVPPSYFLGASGVFLVADLTRFKTIQNLKSDYEFIRSLLPSAIIKVVLNKSDLFKPDEILEIVKNAPVICDFICSAKLGIGVEEAFYNLIKAMLK